MFASRKANNLFLLAAVFVAATAARGASTWEHTRLSSAHVLSFLATSDSPTLYAGTSVGLYISSDGGHLWKAKILAYDSGGRIDFSPVWSLAGEASRVFAATSRGLFLSENGGQRFVKKRTGARFIDTSRPIRIEVLGETVFLGCLNGVALSHNHGETWDAQETTPELGLLRDAHLTTDGIVLAVSEKGVFKKRWEESHWTPITPLISGSCLRIFLSGTDWIALVLSSTNCQLWKSADQGSHWQPFPVEPVAANTAWIRLGQRFFFSGQKGVYEWDGQKSMPVGDLPQPVFALLGSPDGKVLFAGTRGQGVFRLEIAP